MAFCNREAAAACFASTTNPLVSRSIRNMRWAVATFPYSRTAPTRLDQGPAFEGWQTTPAGLLRTSRASSSCTIQPGSSSGPIIRTGPGFNRRGQGQARRAIISLSKSSLIERPPPPVRLSLPAFPSRSRHGSTYSSGDGGLARVKLQIARRRKPARLIANGTASGQRGSKLDERFSPHGRSWHVGHRRELYRFGMGRSRTLDRIGPSRS